MYATGSSSPLTSGTDQAAAPERAYSPWACSSPPSAMLFVVVGLFPSAERRTFFSITNVSFPFTMPGVEQAPSAMLPLPLPAIGACLRATPFHGAAGLS